jgi:hypothetical protein
MIAMKATQLNDRQSLKITQRLQIVVPFLSDREEPPKKTRGKAGLKTSKQYLFSQVKKWSKYSFINSRGHPHHF